MAHISKDALKQKLDEGYEHVVKGGIYSHYKTPSSRYIVEKLVVMEANDELAVAYSPLDEPDITFIRPLASWLQAVEDQPRFNLVEPEQK